MKNSALDFDHLAQIVEQFSAQTLLTEAAVLAACFGLSLLICQSLRRAFQPEGHVLFGRRTVDGALFPVVALLLALLARHLFAGQFQPAVFLFAIPILSSLMVIRLSVRVLSLAFPGAVWVHAVERTISWLAWIVAVLWITGIGPALLEELDEVSFKLGGSTVSVRTLIEGMLTASVVMVLSLWLSAVVERKLVRGTGGDLSVRKVISNAVRVLLLFLGLIFAMSAVGINLTALSVLGGAVGVGLGFGMQKIAANYVSGFIVLAERQLRIGDTVKVDNFEGKITDIRTRYTVIRASNGREAIVPNEMLMVQRVENASQAKVDTQVLVSLSLQVAHGTNVRALQPRLESALLAHPRVLQQPSPLIQLSNFTGMGMELTVKYWLADPNNQQDRVKSEVNLALLDELNAAQVTFSAPQRVVWQQEAGSASVDSSE